MERGEVGRLGIVSVWIRIDASWPGVWFTYGVRSMCIEISMVYQKSIYTYNSSHFTPGPLSGIRLSRCESFQRGHLSTSETAAALSVYFSWLNLRALSKSPKEFSNRYRRQRHILHYGLLG